MTCTSLEGATAQVSPPASRNLCPGAAELAVDGPPRVAGLGGDLVVAEPGGLAGEEVGLALGELGERSQGLARRGSRSANHTSRCVGSAGTGLVVLDRIGRLVLEPVVLERGELARARDVACSQRRADDSLCVLERDAVAGGDDDSAAWRRGSRAASARWWARSISSSETAPVVRLASWVAIAASCARSLARCEAVFELPRAPLVRHPQRGRPSPGRPDCRGCSGFASATPYGARSRDPYGSSSTWCVPIRRHVWLAWPDLRSVLEGRTAIGRPGHLQTPRFRWTRFTRRVGWSSPPCRPSTKRRKRL